MQSRLTFFFCLLVIMTVLGNPADDAKEMVKRDVDAVKKAGSDAAKSLSDAGESAVDAVKPAEKSTMDKIKDGVKGIGE